MTRKEKKKKIFVMPSYIGLNYVLNHFDLDEEETFFVSSNKSFRAFVNHSSLRLMKLPLIEGLDRASLMENKNRIDSFASKISGAEVYFFFYLSAIQEIYLVKKLAINNQVNFIDHDPKLYKYSYKKAFDAGRLRPMLISQIAYRFIFGVRTKMYSAHGNMILGSRLIEFAQRAISGRGRFIEQNTTKLGGRYGLSNVDILYIDNISYHYPESAKLVVSILLDLKSRGYCILVKPHPTFKILNDFKQFDLIDEAIPSDICFHFAQKIIGVSSLSLNFCSTKSVISLLHLLELPAHFIEEKAFQLSKRIWIPESVEGLVKILDAPE